MPNHFGKSVDTTHLNIDYALKVGYVQRDYIAHCLRWSFALRFLNRDHRYDRFKIIDVGCGVDLPLLCSMHSSKYINTKADGHYLAVDVNPLVRPHKFGPKASMNFTLMGETDFCDVPLSSIDPADLIVSFEVLEHVEPDHMLRMLKHMRAALRPDGYLMVSTPCYCPKKGAAKNHVNEMTHSMFGATLEACGFEIEENYGTFASQRDYLEQLERMGGLPLFEGLKEYWGAEMLANIFAPLVPEKSRNAVWVCRKAGVIAGYEKRFCPLAEQIEDDLVLGQCSPETWSLAFAMEGLK